jgi:HrpA-like RNA helicase
MMSGEDQSRKGVKKFIILDEAHILSVETEELLALLKQLSLTSTSVDDPFIIITSATIDADRYAKYFNTDKTISVIGTTSERKLIYTPKQLIDPTRYMLDQINSIVTSSPREHSILIFAPTFMVMMRLTM